MTAARFYFDWGNYLTMLKLLRAEPAVLTVRQ